MVESALLFLADGSPMGVQEEVSSYVLFRDALTLGDPDVFDILCKSNCASLLFLRDGRPSISLRKGDGKDFFD